MEVEIENGTNYPEEYREISSASLCVASLKHRKLSSETASDLHCLKTKIVPENRARRNKGKSPIMEFEDEELPGTPKLCIPLSTYFPNLPSLACLNGVIGRYTEPFKKQLRLSDVDASQCRLSISKYNMKNAVSPILRAWDNIRAGVPVIFYDEEGKQYPMKLIIWASKFHVFKGGWMDFCNDHGLLPHQDFVTLWAFRNLRTGYLSFVITSKRYPIFRPIKPTDQILLV